MIIILSILLLLSISIIAILIWYIRQLLKKIEFVSSGVSDLHFIIKDYHKYLKHIYSMDMFNGEPIVEALIQKTKNIKDLILNFKNVSSVFEEEEEIDLDDDEEKGEVPEEKK